MILRNSILLILFVCGIVACNFGNNITPSITPYLFSSLDVSNSSSGFGCIADPVLFYTCRAESSVIKLKINYVTQPASYLIIPTMYPKGVTESHIGECNESPVFNYSCNVTLSANKAESGIVKFFVTGALGQQKLLQIKYIDM